MPIVADVLVYAGVPLYAKSIMLVVSYNISRIVPKPLPGLIMPQPE